MRRTNKGKKFSKKTRLTKKKRFGKRGGVKKNCPFCNEEFNIMSLYDSRYDAHIRTHPKCKYCGSIFKDKDVLINHFLENHKNKYDVANSINLINELRNNNIDLNEFYTRIENKEKSNEKKAAEKAKKVEQEEQKKLQMEKEEAKKIAKQTAIVEQARIKAEEEEQEKLQKEQERIRQAEIRRQREAEKVEQDKILNIKEEEEKEAKRLEKLEADRVKKAAKRAAKDAAIAERELTGMGQEDILSTEVEIALRNAQTVEDVIEIVESKANNTSEIASTSVRPIKIDLLKMLSREEFNIINSMGFQQQIALNMTRLFPVTKCFSEEINKLTNKENKFNEYKFINNLILFLVGLFNFKFINKNIDVKMIIKGGKGAQMILSSYGYYKNQIKCDITSDDIDILLVQEQGYNRELLFTVAKQFSELIKRFVDSSDVENKLVSIKEPIPDAFNPNVFKISYINKSNPPNIKYNVVSDIDFKKVETEFFDINNIEGLGFPNEYDPYGLQYNYYNYSFNLRYLLQSPQAFLSEKQYYLSIYDNIIQKSSTTEGKLCDCANIIEEGQQGFDYDCYMACKVREMMIPKFQKYIQPFQQLVNSLM
jgi:hypothetical protein